MKTISLARNSNNKLCHIVVADANRCNTNNLQFGEGNATLRRCSEANVKRAIAHDYSATIPPLEIIAYSVAARVYAKRSLSRDSVSAAHSEAAPPSETLFADQQGATPQILQGCAPHMSQVSAMLGASCRQLVPHQEE